MTRVYTTHDDVVSTIRDLQCQGFPLHKASNDVGVYYETFNDVGFYCIRPPMTRISTTQDLQSGPIRGGARRAIWPGPKVQRGPQI